MADYSEQLSTKLQIRTLGCTLKEEQPLRIVKRTALYSVSKETIKMLLM